MTHEMICSWLGLGDGVWPPNHYQLLGLEPGEVDAVLVEQRVQQRLDSIRRYQMMYPEQATEAMNRLAQAFVCLTEPKAKKLYDDSLLGSPARPQADLSPSSLDTAVHPIDMQKTWTSKSTRPLSAVPPPVPAKPPPLPAKPPPLPPTVSSNTSAPPRVPPMPPLPPAADPAPTVVIAAAPPQAQPVPAPPLERIDPILEAARCPEARRGLGTRRAIYQRLLLTRKLLRLWDQVGKHVSSPQRKLKRQSSAQELDHDLLDIIALLKQFPPRLGQAGQPGFLVVALEKQQIFQTFQTMDLPQRQSLSQDWQAGRKLLRAHVAFLGKENRALRRQTLGQRTGRIFSALLFDRPGAVLLGISLTALAVALLLSSLGLGGR
jgi:hypothetical protein